MKKFKNNKALGPEKVVVLFVTHEVSAKIFYRSYIHFLTSQGWSVHLAAKDEGGLEEFAKSENAIAHPIDWKRRPAPMKDFTSLVTAVKLLRKIRPTVVVSATPKAGLLGTLAARITRVPVRIYQLWGLRLEGSRGIVRAVLKALEKAAAASATRVVANSRSLAREAQRYKIASEIEVVGEGSSHGIDLRRFDSGAVDIPELPASVFESIHRWASPVVGFIGRIHRDKGLHILLAACRGYVSTGRTLTLLVIGWSEDKDLLQQLKTPISGLNVILAGKVDDIRPYIRVMDLHCLPTKREGFPNAVLEASAFSVPTITTDATGAIDSVVHEETGWIIPVNNVGALRGAMQMLLEDPELRLRLGENARRRVEEHFGQTMIFEKQEALIRRELREHVSRG